MYRAAEPVTPSFVDVQTKPSGKSAETRALLPAEATTKSNINAELRLEEEPKRPIGFYVLGGDSIGESGQGAAQREKRGERREKSGFFSIFLAVSLDRAPTLALSKHARSQNIGAPSAPAGPPLPFGACFVDDIKP